MATARELSDKEDVELREHNAEMNKLQRDKKELFKKVEPFNKELERITQREWECKDKFQHQREEKHERKTNQQVIERLVGLESENKQLKCEIEKLKSENNSETKTELNETQKRLSDASERLALAEQVTAATQLREVREYDISEKLQLELTPQHHLAPSTGLFSVL